MGPLAPGLQSQLHLTEVQVGWLVAIPVVLGSVMRIPLGILTDRFGARRVFPALMLYTALPLLGLAVWHSSFTVLVALGFLLGFAGAGFAVGVPYLNRWYPPGRQGLSLGVYGMGMGGTVLAGLVMPRMAEAISLTGTFVASAALAAAAGVLFLALAQEPPRPRAVPARVRDQLSVLLTERHVWALTFFYFLAFGGYVAMFLYLPKLLVGEFALTKADAGARAAGFALLAVLARPAGGWLSDRFGAKSVLIVCFAGSAILAGALTGFYTQMGPLTISCLALAVCFGLGTGAVFKLVGEEFPGRVGTVTGVVGAAGGLGGFFPPLVMSFVKTALGSYTMGFWLLSGTAVLCLVVVAAISPAGPAARPRGTVRRPDLGAGAPQG